MDGKCFAIVIGSILGDGYVTKPVNQQQKSQLWLKYDDKFLPYLKWLHRNLKPLGVSSIRLKNKYHQHHFRTRLAYEFWQLRKIFYPKDKKIIPENINKLLTSPLSIAIWYMDDGNLDRRKKYHCNASFATYNFTRSDCGKLRKVMLNNFHIKTSVHQSTMRGKIYYRLYVLSESMKDFIKLVSPYIHFCLSYKIKI